METRNEFELIKMIAAPWISQSIYAVVKLGVIDLLVDATDYQALAQKVNANPEVLYRLLQGLVSVGIVSEIRLGTFVLTDIGSLLLSGAAGGLSSLALLWGEEFYQAWGNVLETVQTGNTAFDRVYNTNLFQYLHSKPEVAKTFNDAMTGLAAFLYPKVLTTYDFSSCKRLVDVGGGCGTLIGLILAANPSLKGVLFDQPDVVTQANTVLSAYGVLDRCDIVGGDFFETVPTGGDTYVLSNIIHDWDNDRSLSILNNCRRAIDEQGRLLLVEMVLSNQQEPTLARMTDLNMLVLTGGRERTQEEFTSLLSSSGFALKRFLPVEQVTCIVEAVPN
ncbi:acetylserotonin O-methyltransferase [Nostoc sp. PA-18-2419]|uniref:acetylserotonin O-methyltransferase n=1 Tax=Nostoc sp. PA-18-2419 TaxID=2575443 RepID=UPI001CB8C493|nr:acetylserotonin O-methyltransferase [Nostoc sp. PA-18-2419]